MSRPNNTFTNGKFNDSLISPSMSFSEFQNPFQNFTVYQKKPCKYYERKAAKQKFFASFQSQTDLRLNFKEIFIMNNKKLVPEAKEAMDKFKMEAASDVGVSDTY